MGVLPVQFSAGDTRKTLHLDGSETYTIEGEPAPGSDLQLIIKRRNGETLSVPVRCRLDSNEDVEVYSAGGILQRFANEFLAS